MTSEEYRKNLSNWITTYRLASTLERLKFANDLDFLLAALKDNDFHKNATIKDLYQFRGDLFKITASLNSFVKTVDEDGLQFMGKFDDQEMNFDDLDIKTRIFICTVPFTDPFSNLPILPQTIIEVKELSYANAGEMITAIYTKLVTNSTSKKLIDVFKDGKQETLLNLKILGENFKPF